MKKELQTKEIKSSHIALIDSFIEREEKDIKEMPNFGDGKNTYYYKAKYDTIAYLKSKRKLLLK
jgi:hypothetical protein